MSAVWRASRAAVKRRRLQTFVIGVVVLVSTATIVLALGLVAAASGPFDQAFAKQNGAHVVATYDTGKVSADQIALSAKAHGVTASSGPYAEAAITYLPADAPNAQMTESLSVVGRADPSGAVDKLNVWQGRWATAPGEIVLEATPGATGSTGLVVGQKIPVIGGPTLTVVGFADSVSQSAQAWVAPEQMAALHSDAAQMLYRFADSSTNADIAADQASVTAGLPAGGLTGATSWLAVKAQATSGAGAYIPFLTAFGVLGLAVAALIVVNVVSGAVVAGTRHIGVLKALGYTPGQVMAVYLVMVSAPALAATIVGTVLGNLFAAPVLTNAFENFGGGHVSVAPWVDVVALFGMPLLVVLAAALPSLRARRMSAIVAMATGRAQGSSRGLRIQRWLGGTRLPRSVSLGLGLPFARPARSVLTFAAVVLGVLTVTFATGLTESVQAYGNALNPNGADLLDVFPGGGGGGPRSDAPATPAPKLSAAQDHAMIKALPGTLAAASFAYQDLGISGRSGAAHVTFASGDPGTYDARVVKGHWPSAADEVAASGRFLNENQVHVGDTVTFAANGKLTAMRIVADVLDNDPLGFWADGHAKAVLAPDAQTIRYAVQLKPGTDQSAYMAAVSAGDPGLVPAPAQGSASGGAKVVIGVSVLLTLKLSAVAALGVFNTVVLNTRERRRDLGMLKSIGMTPRQVTAMVVASMGAIGLAGGLVGVPLGFAVHRLVGPAMMNAAHADVTGIVMDVYHAPALVLLGLSGVLIAVLGALVPARRASRLAIAEVLRSE